MLNKIPMSRLLILMISSLPILLWGQVYTPSSEMVTVDGDDLEWTQGEYLYDQDSKMSYAFRKSDTHLFLILRTNQRETLMQSRMSGIEIWVNSDGKKKRRAGVQYPIGMSGRRKMRQEAMGDNPAQARPEGQGRRGRQGGGRMEMPTQIKLMSLYGDEGEPIVAELGTIDKPILAQAQMHEDGFWVYELGLPLEAFPRSGKGNKPWRVGIENPDFEMPDREQFGNRPGGAGGGGGMGRPGGFGPGGMGGPGGGMGQGGQAGGRGRFNPSSMIPMSIWTKLDLF